MELDWYSVRLETRAPAAPTAALANEDAADALMDLLEEYGGVVSSGATSWDATISVQAPSSLDAVYHGVGVIVNRAEKAGMPAWPPVRTEAVRQDVLEAENRRPTLPELVSAPEAAEILGVSPQRLHQLATNANFPEPMYDLRTGRLWLRDAIEAFAERWDRKPGRPRKPTAAAG